MKLSDCVLKVPSETELHLVFSEKAFELARLNRDRLTQAILQVDPNFALSQDPYEVLENETCQSIWSSLGVGILLPGAGEATFDITKLRYEKVILAAEDGQTPHELLRFFLTYLHPVLKDGHIMVPGVPLEEGFTQAEFCDHILNRHARQLMDVAAPELLLDDL